MNGRTSSSQGQSGSDGSGGGANQQPQQGQFQNAPWGPGGGLREHCQSPDAAVYHAPQAYHPAGRWGAQQQGARQGVVAGAGAGQEARIGSGASPPIPSVGQFASASFPGAAGLPNGAGSGSGARGQVEVIEVCVVVLRLGFVPSVSRESFGVCWSRFGRG